MLRAALVDLPFGEAGREPEILVAELADNGIVYECRVWTRQPGRGAEIRDAVLERARMGLTRAGIEIPFPQRTVLIRRAAVDDASGHCRRALAATPLFAGLGDDVLDDLAAASRPLEFAPGEAVVHEGDASLALYVVAAGNLEVERGGQSVGRVGAGEVFGEMALLTGRRRAATVRSQSAVQAIEIDAGALRAVLVGHPELAEELAERVAVRQHEMASVGEVEVEDETPRGLAAYLRERFQWFLAG
ncbi:MAG: cyclic nucleotide-binding domain-containing protein [Acidobacteria bacterium]|nr:cyclic nucleotide-binding domain-containing protein [Acidobacteriota bacterium]